MPSNAAGSARQRLLELTGGMPYELGRRLLVAFFGNPLVQRFLFSGRRRQLRRLYALVGKPPDERRAMTRHLLSSLTLPWQVNALSRVDDQTFFRYIRLENEAIPRAQQERGGVLMVTCHLPAGKLVPLVLARQGYDVAMIEPESFLHKMGARGAEKVRSITLRGAGERFWMKELYQARQVLSGGGVVLVALDGLQGTGGLSYPFLGKERVFHTSLAQLAIQMEIPIVLVFSTVDERGEITMRFQGPVHTGDAALPERERLQRFLAQYVPGIEDAWRVDPGNVVFRHVQHYLRLASLPASPAPAATPATVKEGAGS